jgi:hypothetical protein
LRRAIFILVFAILHGTAYAQQAFDAQSVIIKEDQSLLEFVKSTEQQSNLRFFYLENWLENFRVSKDLNGYPLKDILEHALQSTEVEVIFMYNYAVIFFKDPQQEMTRDAIIESALANKIKVDKIVLGSQSNVVAGRPLKLNGIIKDKTNQNPVAGVTVLVHGQHVNTQTDAKGQYQLTLPAGDHILSFRFLNYEERMLNLSMYESGTVNIELDEIVTTLNEVVISDQSIIDKQVGYSSIKMAELSRTPSFLGETDVIKSLQIKTGVTTVSEASAGFNVRGGGVDQNLVLYDGVPIFNTSHALGFFTAFNSDIIGESFFYNGGIPAEYGGRVSSVLSMSSKEGSFQKWNGDFGIGFVSSGVTVGGPIKRDTSSLIFSLRSTYSDWILDVLQNEFQGIEHGSVAFYDGTIKYTQKLKTGGKLTLSGYTSRDKFQLTNDTTNRWQNIAFGVRYGNDFAGDYHYGLGLYVGHYSYEVSEDDPATAFSLKYKIFYPSLKLDVIKDGRHELSFGLHSTFYNFSPGDLSPTSAQSNVNSIGMPKEMSLESAVYFGDAFPLNQRLLVEAGLRLTMFNRIGSGTVYEYQPGTPLEPKNVVDSTQFGPGEIMKTYVGPEPRLSLRYSLGKRASIKFGYNRIYQYVHLISNTATVTPVDIWQSSNTYFKPQIADQVSIGYFTESKTGMWQGFVEMYFKNIQNILDFKDGANLILNPKLETALLRGTGKSYGAEFSLRKMRGRLEAEINYTYSRSLRNINGQFDTEKINNGDWYASNYDQPHIINFSWRYSVIRKVYFSGLFTYHTGRPISIPITAYEVNHVPVIDFSERNNYRLDAYHRLDLALVIEGSNKRNRKVQGRWTISIYNVYGRKNPYSAFFEYNVAGAVKPNQISLIGIPVPSVTYGFKF